MHVAPEPPLRKRRRQREKNGEVERAVGGSNVGDMDMDPEDAWSTASIAPSSRRPRVVAYAFNVLTNPPLGPLVSRGRPSSVAGS